MSRRFHRATNWIVDFPLVTTAIVLAITTVSALGYFAPNRVLDLFRPVTTESRNAGPVEPESLERLPDVNPFSVTDADAIVLVEVRAVRRAIAFEN